MFSIIIPVYNTEQYLRECLDSLLAQTFTDWEAICVDDGSKDGSAAILDEYATQDSRLRVVHQLNEGVSAARNHALDLVSGSYVGFVDSDDVLGKDWLRAAADAASRTSADIVKMRFRRDDDFRDYTAQTDYKIYRGPEIYPWSALNRGLTVLNFYRRKILADVRFPDQMRIYEDGIFNLYSLLNARTGVQCEYDGYYYRMSETSSFNRRVTEEEYVRFIFECAKWYRRALAESLPAQSLEAALMRIRSHVASHLMEWVRQPESKKGDRTMIAIGVREAESMMSNSLVPVGGFEGVCYLAYYRYDWYIALRFMNAWQKVKARIKRLTAR